MGVSSIEIQRRWHTLPRYEDAAALHMNAPALAAYEKAQQILAQTAADERELWTRMRQRKKARQHEGTPELDAQTRAQHCLGPFGPREEEDIASYLTSEEANSLDELRRCAYEATRAKTQLLEAADRKLETLETAASLSLRFGSYLYPVLDPSSQWELSSLESNRCSKCDEDLRFGFGTLPFKSFHPDRFGCRHHCSALGAPAEAQKEDASWLKSKTSRPPCG
jgi:hypothetical protein